jgi:hypothetical protein
MTRRVVAAALLASFAALPAAEPASPEYLPRTVGVMLTFEHRPAGDFLRNLRGLEETFRASGLDLRWEVAKEGWRPGVYFRVVVVTVRGHCGFDRVRELAPARDSTVPLGWTVVSDGEVIPHLTIDCDRIAAVTAGLRDVYGRQFLPELYRRLASRVVAHELMHVLLRTTEHTRSECLRTPLQIGDLRRPLRLTAGEIQALRELGRPSAGVLASKQ